MINAHQFSRACRQPGHKAPLGSDDAPAFMVVPTGCARRTVARFHREGESSAKNYLGGSKVGEWANHENPSMRSANQAVLDGFDWYCLSHQSAGLSAHATDVETDVTLPSGILHVRLDVVLNDGDALAARAVFWDGPDFMPADAATIAYPFAIALGQLYPGRVLTTIGIWQARRQRSAEVPVEQALGQASTADRILRGM